MKTPRFRQSSLLKHGKLDGKVVVITGASAGVGRACARAFAKAGANIGLLARGRDGLQAAQREVEDAGRCALALQVDVADAAQVEAAAQQIEERLGPIDVWINNAMVSVFSPVDQMTADEFRRVTEVTYLGTVYGTMAALQRMRRRNRGVIVQVGSAVAYRGIPLQSAYCGAKHAIQGFVDSLRCELLHDRSGVRVTMVQLPALNTPHFDWARSRMPCKPQPVPPIYEPEIAAEAIVWAALHNRREMQVGWPTVVSIAANKIVPWLADWYLGRSGYQMQQSDEPNGSGSARPDNLWSPVAGDHGARGHFTNRAHDRSVQLWLSKHRWGLTWLGIGLGAGLLAAALAGKSSEVRSQRSERPGQQRFTSALSEGARQKPARQSVHIP